MEQIYGEARSRWPDFFGRSFPVVRLKSHGSSTRYGSSSMLVSSSKARNFLVHMRLSLPCEDATKFATATAAMRTQRDMPPPPRCPPIGDQPLSNARHQHWASLPHSEIPSKPIGFISLTGSRLPLMSSKKFVILRRPPKRAKNIYIILKSLAFRSWEGSSIIFLVHHPKKRYAAISHRPSRVGLVSGKWLSERFDIRIR